MSLILIIGESGSGKSTSIRNLNPKETFVLQILDKPLPFRAGKKQYVLTTKEQKGNRYVTDNWATIIKVINKINDNKEIKTLIIDDFQYVMAHEFIRRVAEKGWEKFNDIASHAWQVINTASNCRADLNIIFLTHSQNDEYGKAKCKTIGKMLDEKICLEGIFTIIFNAKVVEERYVFQTQTDPTSIAKAPMGMFKDKYIDNDLQFVIDQIENYYNEDIKDD